ncbi:hypothetical protein CYLTODRAFT_488520 [Cylindrobasidium torrendii FP15055 ss-10]|uniref:Uncharacterized protein n=1 Tax=Cylindrobasidium torrendii FP15055 ss-10 TaxID=1314674 RepID=A0A0D7BH80_9AGAR|nr:hypothetical protein CYLTODRAFT_488520 [Cylindrobasidium torrendii FP15055 ss-10]
MKVDEEVYDKYEDIMEDDSDGLAELLSTVRDSLGSDLPSNIEECRQLLENNFFLRSMLLSALVAHDLERLEHSSLLCSNPMAIPWSARLPFQRLVQATKDMDSAFRHALEHSADFPFASWSAGKTSNFTHIELLRIPLVYNVVGNKISGKWPCIILHALGSFAHNPESLSRINKLFIPRANTFLLNATATGKTRLLFEGLCWNWGLFFSGDYSDGFGEHRFVDLMKNKTTGFQSNRAHVYENVRFAANMILLSRLLLLEQFLLSSSASDTMDTRRLWLCLQLHFCLLSDVVLEHAHPFKHASGMCTVENVILDEAITNVLPRVLDALPLGHLFIVIDEANSGTKPSATFSSLDPPESLPMLKQILREWRRHTKDMNVTYIVAGTRIDPDVFTSEEPVSADFRWFSGTGSFDNVNKQEDYVRQFLPAKFAATVDGANFVRRVTRFFKGRHRNTAHLMADIVRRGLQNPHGVLTANICRNSSLQRQLLDGFEPFPNYESDVQKNPPYDKVYSPLMISTLQDALLIYLAISDRPLRFGPDKLLVSFVNEGLGYFVDDDLQEVTIEPTYMLSTISFFQRLKFDILDPEKFTEKTRAPYKSARPALCLVALTLARVFTAPKQPFSRRFMFLGPSAPWAEKSARIICPRTSKSTWASYIFQLGQSIIHSADDVGDIGRWFETGTNLPFCIYKPTTADPVLLFAVSFKASKSIWVALRVLLKESPTQDDVLDALKTTLPDDVLETFAPPTPPDAVTTRAKKNLLFRLPNRREDGLGEYSVLRVIIPLHADEANPISFDDDIRDRLDFPAAVMYLQRDHVNEDSCKARVEDVIARAIAEVPLVGGSEALSTTSSVRPQPADEDDRVTPTASAVLEEAIPDTMALDEREAGTEEPPREGDASPVAGTSRKGSVEDVKSSDEGDRSKTPDLKRSRSDSVDLLGTTTPKAPVREPQRRRTEEFKDGSPASKDT